MDLKNEITRVAHEIYLEHGSQPGRDLENWLLAEEIVFSRLVSDREREEHIGKNTNVRELHVIEPTTDTVNA